LLLCMFPGKAKDSGIYDVSACSSTTSTRTLSLNIPFLLPCPGTKRSP